MTEKTLNEREVQLLKNAAQFREEGEYLTVSYTTNLASPARRRLGDPEVDHLEDLNMLEGLGSNAAQTLWRYRITSKGLRFLVAAGHLPLGATVLRLHDYEGILEEALELAEPRRSAKLNALAIAIGKIAWAPRFCARAEELRTRANAAITPGADLGAGFSKSEV